MKTETKLIRARLSNALMRVFLERGCGLQDIKARLASEIPGPAVNNAFSMGVVEIGDFVLICREMGLDPVRLLREATAGEEKDEGGDLRPET
ncbi:MAG: hypothetical protein ACOC4K_00415 [Verrucomicrobiota bacterium]